MAEINAGEVKVYICSTGDIVTLAGMGEPDHSALAVKPVVDSSRYLNWYPIGHLLRTTPGQDAPGYGAKQSTVEDGRRKLSFFHGYQYA